MIPAFTLAWPSFYICLSGSALLQLSISLKHAISQLTTPLLPDIIVLIQAALDLMFVCLVLIGLTSDVVCVRVYYRGRVVISKTPPGAQPPPVPLPSSPLLLTPPSLCK